MAYLGEVDFPTEIDHVLVCYCSDPYYRESTEEFFRQHLGLVHYDQLVFPGGPEAVVISSTTFTVDRRRVELLHKKHQFERVVGVAHLNCVYYRLRYPSKDDEARRMQQESDLREFVRVIQRLVPGATVEIFYAAEENGRVSFRQSE